ncbi:hypothetical protein [Thermus phage P23-45]|uniref:Uncharacterized protein n=2 Tax=Oshimavirus TaxID=1623293 RepID=A7XXA8_BP234|nr:hypothetical protein P23p77 [Thermus phage P23-45]YP_001468046.1 hypothetical protein P74p76 [Thermus phage P74-26]ABU96910.1 hypothetical protein P23p77 [Thermus phage P23-45]ABU97026.1 hypothetical protein P74p76 [Thermus phage P74-26]UYB98399.1 hypothetical protein [Thermus phage P23-45]
MNTAMLIKRATREVKRHEGQLELVLHSGERVYICREGNRLVGYRDDGNPLAQHTVYDLYCWAQDDFPTVL